MGKEGKERKDKYYHLAKEQNLRARSSFKLVQIAQRHRIFERCECLIDLCAAPGGWTLVAKKNMPMSSTIVAIDLNTIARIEGVTTIKADITTQKCRGMIKKSIGTKPVDVILHDGSPNMGTSWSHDAFTQNELVLHSIKLMTEFLRPNGIFVTKVFRSADYNSLLWVANQLFQNVTATKPQASRNVSAETYLVCTGYKAPGKIDPKLLDPKSVFVSVVAAPGEVGVDGRRVGTSLTELFAAARKKNRKGYADDESFKKIIPIQTLLESKDPQVIITSSNTISFDPKDTRQMWVKNHFLTNNKILNSLEDLQVCGLAELKKVLDWRIKLQVEPDYPYKVVNVSSSSNPIEEAIIDSDEELQQLLHKEDRASKKKRQKEEKRQEKFELRKKMSYVTHTQRIEENDDDLFLPEPEELSKVRKRLKKMREDSNAVDTIYTDSEEDIKEALNKSRIEEINDEIQNFENDGLVDDHEKYIEMMSKGIDIMDKYYKDLEAERATTKKVTKNKQKAVKKRRELLEKEIALIDAEEGLGTSKSEFASRKRDLKTADEVLPANPLMTDRWFANPIFDESGARLEPTEEVSSDQKQPKPAPVEEDEHALPVKKKNKKQDRDPNAPKKIKKCDGIELVAAEAPCPPAFEKEPTPEEVMEIQLIGKQLIKKKGRMDLIDDGFNTLALDDKENFPQWFLDEEKKYMQPLRPYTREEMQNYMRKLRDVADRPAKKVLEAQARKKKRSLKRSQKMEKILGSSDMSESQKGKKVRALKRQASKDDLKNKKKKPVDARLKMDKRGEKRAEMKRFASKGGKGAKRRR
eukprot:GHVP01028767.1.p1 GENE.GHVP01028767.1~~GHVP01028767.1.p1  ORF type:complete len:809 (+),score=198.31 GHVP01028767.1:27-2453(+)